MLDYEKEHFKVCGPEDDATLLLEALPLYCNQPATIHWGWSSSHSVPKGLVFNKPTGLQLVADKGMAYRVLRWARCPAIRTIEPILLHRAIYPIMGWQSDSLYSQPAIISSCAQAKSITIMDVMTPHIEITSQSILHVVRSEIVWAETYDKAASKWFGQPDITEDEKQLAVKATYHLGLDAVAIKIAKTPKGNVIVGLGWPKLTSYLAAKYAKAIQKTSEIDVQSELMMGADCELILIDGELNELVPASYFLRRDGRVGYDDRSLENEGTEFPLVELRPSPSTLPQDIVNDLGDIMKDLINKVPYKNLEWHAGAMPIPGYQTGGHIHFSGIKLTWDLARSLDNYLTLPICATSNPGRGRWRRRTQHGVLGLCRIKDYGGFEYVPVPSWLVSPDWALAVLTLARFVAINHKSLGSCYFDNYYLKLCFSQGIKIPLMVAARNAWAELMSLPGYNEVAEQLKPIKMLLDSNAILTEEKDIRIAWEIDIPQYVFQEPAIIAIKKKHRSHLKVSLGDKIQLHFGNQIAEAEVVTCRDSGNASPRPVLISNGICQTLGLPKGCNMTIKPSGRSDNGLPMYRVGPVIGLLVESFSAEVHELCHLLYSATRDTQVALICFTPIDIDLEKNIISGYSLTSGEFSPIIAPLPDGLYHRLDVLHEQNYNILSELALRGVAFYNSPESYVGAQDKRSLLQWLSDVNYLNTQVIPVKPSLTNLTEDIAIHRASSNWQNDDLMLVNPKYQPHEKFTVQYWPYSMKPNEKVPLLRAILQKDTIGQWIIVQVSAYILETQSNQFFISDNPSISRLVKDFYSSETTALRKIEDGRKLAKEIAETLDQKLSGINEIVVDLIFGEGQNTWVFDIDVSAKGPEPNKPSSSIIMRRWADRLIKRLIYISGYQLV